MESLTGRYGPGSEGPHAGCRNAGCRNAGITVDVHCFLYRQIYRAVGYMSDSYQSLPIGKGSLNAAKLVCHV